MVFDLQELTHESSMTFFAEISKARCRDAVCARMRSRSGPRERFTETFRFFHYFVKGQILAIVFSYMFKSLLPNIQVWRGVVSRL